MKHLPYLFICLLAGAACRRFSGDSAAPQYTIIASAQDQSRLKTYRPVFRNSAESVSAFFQHPFQSPFTLVIHPDRHSLDSCWQHDWQMPDFHSECWMVASGVATRLDLLSPETWKTSACEHDWKDSLASARLIAHEMAHVFHGQHNPSPDFSQTQGLDWFVEGLAVLASRQCDSIRTAQLRKWLQTHQAPESLDLFWTGSQKYGLSGSMLMFIDQKIGRKKLYQLLAFTRKDEVLKAIQMGEPELIKAWRQWLEDGGPEKYYY